MNSVNISGNLGQDANMRTTSSGMAIANFSVAVNNRQKDANGDWKNVASWVDCVLFGKRAEALQQYLTKGKTVGITGHLHQNSWESKEGQKRSKLEVIIDEIDLLGGKADSDNKPKQQSEPSYDYDIPF